MIAKVKAFDLSQFGTAAKDISTLTSVKYSTPTQKLKDEHPRVSLTADMIPAIKAAMENAEDKTAVSTFKSYVETDYSGVLPAPSLDYQGRKGLHNCDKKGLAIIEAKPLNYLLTGDALYGWQAIYAMLNNINTLDIQYINSDQYRDYGYVMFIAAEVYDWCSDLLTDELKAGLYPQGSSYVNTRFYSDLYSAWLYMQATGENPYTGS
ncbi:MAG: hypothetical protein E7463_14190 [Ruminococcaceae bacterium]|nr:hypothetical protein [Oscillospiraceae bacterium]